MEKFEIKNMLYKVNIKSRALSVMLYLVDSKNRVLKKIKIKYAIFV